MRVRAKYTYDKKYNCIDVTEIPPTTTAEAIIDKIVELVKTNKVREISDIRDETDLTGLKITIDLKRGVHADDLMLRLYKMTPLEDSFSCNFNVLVDGKPKVYGVRELLMAWIDFRLECVRRRLTFMLNKSGTSCICSRVCPRFCWILTRRLRSSGRPRQRSMWCPI